MPNVTGKMKAIQANCPDGYTVSLSHQSIDMLGKTELWLIYSNHPEPVLTRIPQDFVDRGDGNVLARRPKEWGYLMYFKVA